MEDGNQNVSESWYQTIDFNGDGRVDTVSAGNEGYAGWLVYLNIPDPANPGHLLAQRRVIKTDQLVARLKEAGHQFVNGDVLPLSRTTTAHDFDYNHCWEWTHDSNGVLRWVLTIAGYSGPDNNRCHYPQGQLSAGSHFGWSVEPEKTIVEWELRDINGDGYPDFIYNASPVSWRYGTAPSPSADGTFPGQFAETTRVDRLDLVGSADVMVMYNVGGTHIDAGTTRVAPDGTTYVDTDLEDFAAPVKLETAGVGGAQPCGVGRWTTVARGDTTIQLQMCGFEDINGDGLTDRLSYDGTSLATFTNGVAMLGTGDPSAPFNTGAMIRLPGALGRTTMQLTAIDDQGHYKPTACPAAETFPDFNARPNETFPTQRTIGLRDLNGDGFADYIVGDRSTGTMVWTVAFGTGTGFAPATVVVSPVGLELSADLVGCFQNVAEATTRGLYDIDGDGQPEVVVLNDGKLDLYQLNATYVSPDVGNAPSPPTVGRLVKIDNGYGASVNIGYRSAKEDVYSVHAVPFPEIVVSAVSTRDNSSNTAIVSPTLYAYGGAAMYFDPAYDTFRFPGYERTIQLRGTSDQVFPPPTEGIATIMDMYALDSVASSPDLATRFRRYLKVGRLSDSTTLAGNVGLDPWALLTVNIVNDARRISGSHHTWDAHALPPGLTGTEACLDMVYPYDLAASIDASVGGDPCTQHGFAFESSVIAWRGTPGATGFAESAAVVITQSDTTGIDDFGRVTARTERNDLNRFDDDLCFQTTYATPAGSAARVLSAPALRVTSNCTLPQKVFAQDRWSYAGAATGQVTTGLVASQTVSRFNLDSGVSLGDIHLFDAVYDAASGNLSKLSKTRDDGAVRKVTLTYDPFGLATTSLRVDAVNADASKPATLLVSTTRDPLTLVATGTTDANGTRHDTTFDGLGRILLSSVTPPGGASGVLSSMSYLGFASNESGGRQVKQKLFADAVPAGSVATATGRTATTFFDALDRPLRIEVALGADYPGQTFVSNALLYDSLGRVLFEADPYVSGDAAPYGTTRYYNTDGTPSCAIRGRWLQARTNVAGATGDIAGNITDEANERYPSCTERLFAEHTEWVRTRDAASLSTGPQAAVIKSTFFSATRLPLASVTYGTTGAPTERTTFVHDPMGNLTKMVRYGNPASVSGSLLDSGSNGVETQWHYDSLGRVLELDEPDSAAQQRTYDSWGEQTLALWPAFGGSTERRTIARYDALGRLTHREDRTGGALDPETVNDYLYDQAFHLAQQVNPTNLKGRLAQASWPTGQVAFGYDERGKVNARVFGDADGNVTGIEQHTFHADGTEQALDLRLPDAAFVDEQVTYTYDSAGRERSATYADGTTTQSVFAATTLDAFGRIRQAQYGAASYTASYADTGRRLLSSVNVASPGATHSRQIAFPAPTGLSTAFDPLGRERGRVETKDGETTTLAFAYDQLGELGAASRTPAFAAIADVQLTYDPLGNLLTQSAASGTSGVTLSYQTIDRDRICSIGYGVTAPAAVCNVKYDSVGNIIEQPTRANGKRTLSYFAHGGVKEVKDGSGNDAVFHYDAFGGVQALEITSSTSPDTRHDEHYGTLITKRDELVGAAPTPVLTRAIPAGGGIATRHGATTPAKWTFAFGEGRGNRFFTDETGNFVQDVDYQAYGEATSTGAAQPGSRGYTSAQWNGGDALAALGLSQLGARLYDPVLGRFLSRDPLIIPRTAAKTNPYAFAMNDPINCADPSGLDSTPPGDEGDTPYVPPEPHDAGPQDEDGNYWQDGETINVHPAEDEGLFPSMLTLSVDLFKREVDVVSKVADYYYDAEAPSIEFFTPAARAAANFVEHKIQIHTFGPRNTSEAIEIALDQVTVIAAIAGAPEAALEEGAVLESLEADLVIEEGVTEGAGGATTFTADLSHVTGRTAQVRNAWIEETMTRDLPGIKFSYTPEYSPFIEDGFAVAKKGVGTQIGPKAFGSQKELIDTLVHEELHHRWWSRGIYEHHANLELDARFEAIIQRYMKLRGF